ncbi:copper oxidase [Arthrobacter sp. SW1]|uniref:multicopper oxidase family protein n=1 Tax=Arthrobacter sp. SW1 TaxID=1920889 RepID=UPI000877CCD6|nr:multicopper oxidase family protein [Arthrobacter sp. SW1]OFI38197.1 copper oxidase [Arthrobacter sp. SW1]
MQPVSRRAALLLGGLGLAGTAAGAAGLYLYLAPSPEQAGGVGLAQAPVLRSSAGRLELRLEAAQVTVPIAGRPASCFAYNGSVPGPTLRLRAGDTLAVRLVNNLREASNLHVHGLHVSPQGNGDNAFVTVEPGRSFDYEFRLPDHHPPGVYWYHPHLHGSAADQVFAGLYGAIIVEEPRPPEVARERILVVSDITVDGSGNIRPPSAMERMAGREGRLLLLNGQVAPVIEARPGERERWRIVNACVARYLRLSLDGQALQQPGDGTVFLAPGNRADLLFTAASGESVLRTLPYDRGGGGMMAPGGPGGGLPDGGAELARVRVSGDPGPPLAPVAGREAPADLRRAPVAARRQLVFGSPGPMGMMDFTINGRRFNPARTDIAAAAGSVEEWTLLNNTPMDHPFHLHVWPMQPVEEDGLPLGTVRFQDVVNVPSGRSVKVRISFNDFTGRTVYHCHILDHEDLGMMGVIEVR